MAYELYGVLSGAVSLNTREKVRPAYGGDCESFLKNVVTPIYKVIYEVLSSLSIVSHSCTLFNYLSYFAFVTEGSSKEQKWGFWSLKVEKLWWSEWVFLVRKSLRCHLRLPIVNFSTISLLVNCICIFFFSKCVGRLIVSSLVGPCVLIMNSFAPHLRLIKVSTLRSYNHIFFVIHVSPFFFLLLL